MPDFSVPRRFVFRITSAGALLLFGACTPNAQNSKPAELPYFVNLQPDEAWGRRGPSYKQPVLWVYKRRGLPLLVIDETTFWRQVRDADGAVVWMHKSLLSSRPMAMVIAKSPIPLYRTASEDETVVAYADPRALLRLGPCQSGRCQLKKGNIRGWADKSALWGAVIPPDALP